MPTEKKQGRQLSHETMSEKLTATLNKKSLLLHLKVTWAVSPALGVILLIE